jgi:hypothetical protein
MAHDYPEWWEKNAALREEMGLPEYEPSRFTDGAYVHEVIEEIEEEYDCEVELVSEDPSYPSQWTFRINGTDCAETRRHRDKNGNNVYQLTTSEFRRQVTETIER